jgi:hypothetical protein
MFIVSVDGQIPLVVYVIRVVPVPATEGLKVPADEFVIPVPDHVPPPVAELSDIDGLPTQIGETAVIVELSVPLTTMLTVSEDPQLPPIE